MQSGLPLAYAKAFCNSNFQNLFDFLKINIVRGIFCGGLALRRRRWWLGLPHAFVHLLLDVAKLAPDPARGAVNRDDEVKDELVQNESSQYDQDGL